MSNPPEQKLKAHAPTKKFPSTSQHSLLTKVKRKIGSHLINISFDTFSPFPSNPSTHIFDFKYKRRHILPYSSSTVNTTLFKEPTQLEIPNLFFHAQAKSKLTPFYSKNSKPIYYSQPSQQST